MKQLGSVNDFGSVDADNDRLLREAFEDHEAYKNVLNRSRFLVIGRKGTGKTAIYRKLITLNSHDTFTYGFTFVDYPWHLHDIQTKMGVPEFEKYKHSWTYFILMSLSKLILNYDQSIPASQEALDSSAILENFVLDTYGSRDVDITRVFTPAYSIKWNASVEANAGFAKAGASTQNVPMKELPSIISEVNSTIMFHTLRSLNPDHKYIIAFDQLDYGFKPSDETYKQRIIGLILAAKELNNAAREEGINLLVTVFLRDDIYSILQFEDKNKVTVNFVSLIEWDTPRTNHTLKNLMERRFLELLREGGESVDWDNVFDETREMPGRQAKYKYILDRTFNRPRDMIMFCNSILSKYKDRGGVRDVPNKFNNADINDAKADYSTYFLNEIDDEVHKHIPDYKRYLDVIRRVGVWYFDLEDFSHSMTIEFGPGKDHVQALKDLFEFSIIGFLRSGGRAGGTTTIYKYKEPNVSFDHAAKRFRVHPGLIEVLDLRRNNANNDTDDE
ncbi:P-loop ATPase, Sll1717 family [Deinococcus ficus]|uniref:P-loop ATPase, Sll1717 family n=1 Tax=Deinococcus ficus TaxID=317577 RepID=UPI0012DF5894|nr:hypothetical protein [Deinococcus ficus]